MTRSARVRRGFHRIGVCLVAFVWVIGAIMALLTASSATSLEMALAYAAASLAGFMLMSVPVYAVAGGLGCVIAVFLSEAKPRQSRRSQSTHPVAG
jgi:hypothetical protein